MCSVCDCDPHTLFVCAPLSLFLSVSLSRVPRIMYAFNSHHKFSTQCVSSDCLFYVFMSTIQNEWTSLLLTFFFFFGFSFSLTVCLSLFLSFRFALFLCFCSSFSHDSFFLFYRFYKCSLRLADILVRPTQRLTKYGLLLGAIRKHVVDENDAESLDLMVCVDLCQFFPMLTYKHAQQHGLAVHLCMCVCVSCG